MQRRQGKLEPGPNTELTPQRLAAFYRSVGGNYDSLFLNNSGLSFMYRMLGCFHTLQPTPSPFDVPCIPALLPGGFVEWQRIQLLLTPGEHVPFMQEAVKRYDVPTADGGIFPKYIPREVFPDRPDESMEEWHKKVTGSLEQEQYSRKLKTSPYASSRDPPNRGDGYLLANGKARRNSRSPQSNSHDLDPARRSSGPDIPLPLPSILDNTHRGSDVQQYSTLSSRTKQAQYKMPHHTSNISSQHRTSDTPSPRHSSHRTSNSSASHRPARGASIEPGKQWPPPAHRIHHHRRPRSPSTIDESSSGSEASSEDSFTGRSRNSHEARDGRWRGSLFPPESIRHLRRHSHDAACLSNSKPPPPPRPIDKSPHVQDPMLSARPGPGYQNGPTTGAVSWNANPIQFNTNVFKPRGDEAANSAPESPVPVEKYSRNINSKLSMFDPAGPRGLVRQYNAEDMDQGRAYERKSSIPLRIPTVTGVGGRKYAATESMSAFAGSGLSPPTQLGMLSMADSR